MTDERYTIRRAVTSADLEGAREVFLGVTERDAGYGYTPKWHWDMDRLLETYVDNERQAMFVAVAPSEEDPGREMVVATAAVRIGGPRRPPHAEWLAARYADRPAVAQLMRVATLPEHRRRGLARRLVAACLDFARRDGRYRVVYLHTNARVPGAEVFWRSLPVKEICDARGDADEQDPRFETIHFELPLDARID